MQHPGFHWIPSGCKSAPIWSLLQHESNYMISKTVQKHDISEQQELPIFGSSFQMRKKTPHFIFFSYKQNILTTEFQKYFTAISLSSLPSKSHVLCKVIILPGKI